MLGWEFPPAFSGGLGVVTKNLIESLHKKDQDVTLLLPQFVSQEIMDGPHAEHLTRYSENYYVRVKTATLQKIIHIPTSINSPYESRQSYQKRIDSTQTSSTESGSYVSVLPRRENKPGKKSLYGQNLFQEIERFVSEVMYGTQEMHFDVVHAHDWITAEAAVQLKLQRGLPFILHVHATEFDRVGQSPQDSEVFRREQYAMQLADKIIAVSYYTAGILSELYGIDPDKIEVVHNAYTKKTLDFNPAERWKKNKDQFWVLFIGRVTLQKGPDYFVETARKVMQRKKNIHFLMVGDGDMMPDLIETIARENLSQNVHCLGFLPPEDRDALYLFTDACLIPSVSEPFGLTAMEGVFHKSPLVLSNTCGANELIHHKLSVDFWDTDQMAEYILALEKYPYLRRTIRNKALEELPYITWDTQADQIINIYNTF